MPRGTDRYDEARLQGRLWTPKQLITRPKLWIDPSDLSTASGSGGTLTGFADKSGNGSNASGGVVPGKINGRPAMLFNVGTANMRSTVSITGSTLAAWIVANHTGTIGGFERMMSGGVFGTADYNNSLYFNIPRSSSAATFEVQRNGTIGGVLPLAEQTPLVAGAIFDGTVGGSWKNGVSGTTAASTGNFGIVDLIVGYNATAGNNWSGMLGEYIVLDYVPVTYERQKIEGYLAWRWGIPLDAASHPYLNRPPTIGG